MSRARGHATKRLLAPAPATVPATRSTVGEVEVPAPASWRVRAGAPARTTWTIVDRRWDRPAELAGDVAARRPPIVLVHGLGVAAGMCAPLARRLAATGPVFAPDLPGHGHSGKPVPVPDVVELGAALADWLPAVVTAPAVLVGVSLGCQVVVETAATAPDWVSAVVLASPIVDPDRRRWRHQLWRWRAEQSTQSWRLKRVQVVDYRRAGLGRVVRTFASALRQRPEDRIRQVAAPVLICRGTRDPLVGDAWASDLRTLAHHARLRRLPGVVHAMSHDNPVEFARVIHGFLDQVARCTGGVDGVPTEVPG
ncbi:alpha/beta hydrolase [Solwaraspora sp. WMMD406]|uniref:alpha/beta fold hydrolase n=1 Tax=Solwaraspora sp. WMMD406 TaxID=3016095 RepID=UPI0024169E46|nr:alpha/beta hydrolase [Solwaraspora sp. WMMD406]MDG4765498.1 alpha/beta hydrolase [Solwaraspora sp. WMMD406]